MAGDDIDDGGVWAVTCFVVKVGHRRRGIGPALLDAAVAARTRPPARTPSRATRSTSPPGERQSSSAELYHGTLSTFLAAGFEEVGRTGPTRPVVRLALG